MLSSEYLLIHNAKNRLKIKQDSWWVEFKIFSERSSQKFVWKKNNKQTLLFNIYLSNLHVALFSRPVHEYVFWVSTPLMNVFFSSTFILNDFSCMHFANHPPHNFSNGPSLKNNYYYMTLAVCCIFFQSISILLTQDTADVKHQPHVHLVSTFLNCFRTCNIAMLTFFLLTGQPVASPV